MSNSIKILAEKQDIVAIASAVRNKTGLTNEMTLGEIVDGINGISTGANTSDATAKDSDIMLGKTAYAGGSKITGSFTIDNELSTQDDLIAQIMDAVDNLPEANSGGNLPSYEVMIDMTNFNPSYSMQPVIQVCYIKADGTIFKEEFSKSYVEQKLYNDVSRLLVLSCMNNIYFESVTDANVNMIYADGICSVVEILNNCTITIINL